MDTMARKCGGIGAVGSAKGRFFHPSAKVREKWPNQHQTIRLTGVLVVGKGTHRVNRKDQLCYECRIPEIDDNTVSHICVGNFKVEEAPSTPFPDEVTAAPARVAPPTRNEEGRIVDIALRMSHTDVPSNISGKY